MPKLKKRKKPRKKEGRQEHCCFQECIRKAGHETESSSKQSRETDAALWGSKSHNKHSGAHKLQKTRRQVQRIKSTKRATLETKAYKPQKKALADTDTGRERERERERVSYPTPNNRNPQEFSSTQEDLTHMKSRKTKKQQQIEEEEEERQQRAENTHKNSKPQLFWRRSLRNQSGKKGEKSQKQAEFFWCKSQELQERSPSALSNRAQISARGNPSDFEEAISRWASERRRSRRRRAKEKKGVFILHSLTQG